MFDAIVVGGSYAGMAAALQLLRARRTVLIVDAGQRRNRFASHAHAFLTQDGVDPAEIARIAREQLEAYPNLTWIDGAVTHAEGRKDDFRIVLQSGESNSGRRLVFATGLKDDLPKIPGLAERFGQSVFLCPYCHGYELDRGRIGVIATGDMSLHQAQLLPEWGAVTFLTNEAVTMDAAAREDLARRGVTIEEAPIARIESAADVVLGDGRRLGFAGLFTASKSRPSSSVAEDMGCVLSENPMGVQIRTAESKETSIPGIYACGDVAKAPHSLTMAVADGAWAGANIHRSLVWPDA